MINFKMFKKYTFDKTQKKMMINIPVCAPNSWRILDFFVSYGNNSRLD